MDTLETFEVGSDGWFDVLFAAIRRRLDEADLSGIHWSRSEEFTSPPAHLARPGTNSFGWTVWIRHGEYTLVRETHHDVDLLYVVDYAAFLTIAKLIYADIPDIEERLERFRASGRESYWEHGRREDVPAEVARVLDGLHDELAVRTK